MIFNDIELMQKRIDQLNFENNQLFEDNKNLKKQNQAL